MTAQPMGAGGDNEGSARPRAAFLMQYGYAHRGLHGVVGGADVAAPLENSMAAFQAALDAGYGIECDVRLSADGVAWVIHDDDLTRLTGSAGNISAMTSADVARRPLLQNSGPIPRLSELLALAAGRVPVLIELKIEKGQQVGPLCSAVAWDLMNYVAQGKGAGQGSRPAFVPAVIMSFHPDAVRWFRTHLPEIVRGLVITDGDRTGPVRGLVRRFLRFCSMDWARPDFVAYDVRDLSGAFARKQYRKGRPVLSWTVRDAAHWQTVQKQGAAPIFELGAAGTLSAEALAVLAKMQGGGHG